MDNCDVLIIGTGLQESILAAALSWQGTQVLHIDSNTYYGDSCSTLTIEQLKKWCGDVNSGKSINFKMLRFIFLVVNKVINILQKIMELI